MMSDLAYFLILLLLVPIIQALGQASTIEFEDSHGSLKLADSETPVRILVDSLDWPGVLRAVKDVALDFGRVTGKNGEVSQSLAPRLNDSSPLILQLGESSRDNNRRAISSLIIAGTLGKSALIDDLIRRGKIDVSSISGKWETFSSQVIEQPVEGVSSALVLAGSDKRGTIFGLYDVSEQIGVSPWYYWADVSPKKRSKLFARNVTAIRGPPSVKYRGIFLNDEAPALTGFVNSHFRKSQNATGYNSDFYTTVFELLLRLRANTLWPAMWGSMFNVDDTRNQQLADTYGIVMGTSHTEPMMRATNEWQAFGKGSWKWRENNESIIPFFVNGARRAKAFESIFTLGMRGAGDSAMSPDIETDTLQDIIRAQKEILNRENMSDVEQVWCLYKEVLGYHDAGMRVPDDVTLLWADDNWGNIRRLPTEEEQKRRGGAGVYYHFDYVGDPRNYKWINTVRLQKTWLQLNIAHQRRARKIWIVNVGDLKPLEIPINHFMDIAYDISRWGSDPIDWLSSWAAREFQETASSEVAEVVRKYSDMAGSTKFELVGPETYSVINYEECDGVLNDWRELAKKAQEISTKLDVSVQDSFFEMVLHPILAGYTFHKIQIGSARNNLGAKQGRTDANRLAEDVLEAFKVDHELTRKYNEVLNGKWRHMMDQTHLGYVYWQQPMRQATPPLQFVQTLESGLQGDMGVSVEGQLSSIPGDDRWHGLGSNSLNLPKVSRYSPSRWIDIFATGVSNFTWKIETERFVKVSKRTGFISPIDKETSVRVYINIDWSSLRSCPPFGTTGINITSSTPYGTQFAAPNILLSYNSTNHNNFSEGFLETDGSISVDAWSYPHTFESKEPQSTSGSGVRLLSIPHYGLTLFPFDSPALQPSMAPYLDVRFLSFSNKQNASILLYLAPSLNTDPSHPLRYALSLDSGRPREVQIVQDQPAGQLPAGWEDAVIKDRWESKTTWNIPPGEHSLKIWLLDVGVVLKKMVIDLGGLKSSWLGPPQSFRVGKQK